MGHFVYFDPNQYKIEAAEELQPQLKPKKVNLLSPNEWTYCEKESELTRFARRNSK